MVRDNARFKMRLSSERRGGNSKTMEYRWEAENGWCAEGGRWYPSEAAATAAWHEATARG